MAVFDTHKAFIMLVEAGFTERQAQACWTWDAKASARW